MRDILKICFMFFIVAIVYIYKDNISNFILDEVIYHNSNKVITYNEYYLNYDYEYVQNTDEFTAKSYKDVLNIFYTVLNSGDDSFSFNCDYDNCINDVKRFIASDKDITYINNFVHPFNSFATINIDITNSGKITIRSKKIYNDYEIQYIKDYVQSYISNNITSDMSDYDKIKLFHDHIINNTEYEKKSNENSHTAYYLLTRKKAICGGYSDIMAIYLNTLGIQNYRITSDNHVWNLVNLDSVWYHLDLTWDDPVASDGKQYLLDNFFLISTNELLSLDKAEHNFDKNVYVEAK